MKVKKMALGTLILIGLLVGSLAVSAVLSGQPDRAAAQASGSCVDDDDGQETAETEDMDDVEEEVECGPQDEDGNELEEVEEGYEADTSDEIVPADTSLTAVQAQAIAEEANPGVATLDVEFDRENGHDIWEVELDNGLDVKVDAADGTILLTETRD